MESNKTSIDEKTIEYLKKDFSILLKALDGKRLEEINLKAIIELLEMLKNEVINIQNGQIMADAFISRTVKDENIPDIFAKKENTPKR